MNYELWLNSFRMNWAQMRLKAKRMKWEEKKLKSGRMKWEKRMMEDGAGAEKTEVEVRTPPGQVSSDDFV